ncbi:MAG: GNAT family N-acetyltransferase [Planctomycetota bacterium]|jgi:GNAT superfamily N-acetyltransferase
MRYRDLELNIEEYDPTHLSEPQWESFFELHEQRFRENFPDDPLPAREPKRKYMTSPHPHWEIAWWRAFSPAEDRFVGLGGAWFESERSPSQETNRHIGYVDIYIDRRFRRRGIGTAYLNAMLARLRKLGKSRVRAESAEADSGVAFCRHLGGTLVAERHVNRLQLGEVDWSLMQAWREDGRRRAEGVTLERFQEVPEEDLDEFCRLYTETTRHAPAGDLAGEPLVTPAKRRQDEKEARARGLEWNTLISREADGTISGVTETFYERTTPHRIEQELTGVGTRYQGRGLGKWLKSEMLFFIRHRYPDAQVVDAGNADHNAPMMSINARMGFRNLLSQAFFEFEMTELCERLGC